MTQNRVLFVDDEPSILAIYQMLDSFLGDEFKIATATGGEEALGLVEQSTFDVVVSDLTMPKMTGVEFLTEVARRSPASARIVVSGFVDEVSVAKCCMVGHRYFIKPFDPIALTALIQNLSRTKKPPMSKAVHEIIGKIGALPCPSETFLQLTSALNSPTASIQDISDIVSIELQERAQKGKLPARLIFDTEPGTPDKLVTQAQDLISGMGISLKTPGARLELPEAAGFPGSTASEQVIVAINSNGQIFFRNQLMNETALEQKLASVVKSSKQPVAMVLEADKMVPYGKIMKLCEIARKAQIADVTLAHRPNQIH